MSSKSSGTGPRYDRHGIQLDPTSQAGVYRFRRAVPDELRDLIGQREFKVSLRTTDIAVAKRRAAYESIKADRIIEEARTRPGDFLKQQQTRAAKHSYRRRSLTPATSSR